MTTAAQADQAAPATSDDAATLRDVVHAIAAANNGSRRVSAPPPFTRTATGPIAEGRYIPTPSLNGANITAIENYEDHAGYVQCSLDAFNTATEGLTNLSKAREEAKKNGAWTEAQQILVVAEAADKLQARVARQMDDAFKRLTDGIKSLEDSLNAPLTAKADTTLGREVREYVSRLPADKRHAFLTEAIQRKDLPTLHAVLGAQPFLSGLTPQMQAHFTRALHAATQPVIEQRITVMKRALQLVGDRGGMVMREISKCLGADTETVSKLRKAQGAAEQALLLINNPVQK